VPLLGLLGLPPYFTELADIRSAGRKLTEEEWIEVWGRHDQYPA